MRFVFHLVLMLAVALAVGFGLSWYTLTDNRSFAAMEVGPWTAWPSAGTPTPDPYARAYLARTGLLQLGQSEGIQFTADRDSQGELLDRTCTYRIEGQTPTASFWTLVATDATSANIARPDGTQSLVSTRLARLNDGTAPLYVGERLAPWNWLEISGQGPFQLVLTFYDVSQLAGAGSSFPTLPSIVREDCA